MKMSSIFFFRFFLEILLNSSEKLCLWSWVEFVEGKARTKPKLLAQDLCFYFFFKFEATFPFSSCYVFRRKG